MSSIATQPQPPPPPLLPPPLLLTLTQERVRISDRHSQGTMYNAAVPWVPCQLQMAAGGLVP